MKAVVLIPHDDDAVISIGGTLLKLIKKGWKIKYIQMTDGRHGSNIMPPKETKKVRAEEAERERKFLGVDSFYNFGIEDGTLINLNKEEKERLIEKIVEEIREYEPAIVFLPSEFEDHPDHLATYRIGHEALKLSGNDLMEARYVVWHIPFMEHKTKNFEKLLLVGIDDELKKKLEGIKLHASQEKEGRYSKMTEYMNKFMALLYTTYSPISIEAAEIIAITNTNNYYNNFIKDLEKVIDVTNIFHGRKTEGIRADKK